MKVLSIGREEGCQILLHDSSNLVSRRHATLYVTSSGKLTIVDHSSNGTYVNGVRISSDEPFPVSRRDHVSFAQTCELDWKQVPDPRPMRIGLGMLGLLLLVCAGWGIFLLCSSPKQPEAASVVPASDSLEVQKTAPKAAGKAAKATEEKPADAKAGTEAAKPAAEDTKPKGNSPKVKVRINERSGKIQLVPSPKKLSPKKTEKQPEPKADAAKPDSAAAKPKETPKAGAEKPKADSATVKSKP